MLSPRACSARKSPRKRDGHDKDEKTLKKRAINWKLFLIPALCLVGLFLFYYIVPTASGTYTITVLNGALIFYVANIGCALMLGQCGLVSFASVAFMGIGGYASALLAARLGMNPFLAMRSPPCWPC